MLQTLINNWKRPLGIILAITHATVLSWLIMSKEPSTLLTPQSHGEIPCPPQNTCFDFHPVRIAGIVYIAGREFHFSYEHPILQFLAIIDLPALIIGAIVSLPLSLLNLSLLQSSYLAGSIWLIYGSIEWWIIGIIINNAIQVRKKSRISIE